MGSSIARKIRQRLEKSEQNIHEEAKSHLEIERRTLGGTREGPGEILGSNEANKEEKEKTQKKQKQKTDVFQRMFVNITKIIKKLWLERNTDHHRPLQEQKRIAKIIEATQTVTDLYSF